MSSESSDDDTDADSVYSSKSIEMPFIKLKLTQHTITATKKSKDKLKHRLPGPDSVPELPVDALKFSIKSEYRRDA